MSLPRGIFAATEPPESDEAGQGADTQDHDQADEPVSPKPSKARKAKKAVPTGADKDGLKLYLNEDVRFRLRMLAFKRGAKLSTVANEVLDKALPRWSLERTD